MFRESKLAKYLIVSGLLHIIVAGAMARIYAEQPQRRRPLEITSVVRIQYKEPEPPPKPKVVAKAQPKKVAPKKEKPKPKEEPKVTPQVVEAPKITRRRRQMSASAPSLGTGTAPRRSVSSPGVTGIKGARGPVDELPTVRAAGGIEDPDLVTKTGGTGLTPGLTHGTMAMPEGSSHLPGLGGKEVAGFRMGTSGTGSGVGNVDVSGSGGRGGRTDEGPGTGLGSFAGRVNVGSGSGTTGLGVGKSDGMEKVDAESTGSRPGDGRGGPGVGGHQVGSSRAAPSLASRSGSKTGGAKELPGTESIPEEKRDGAIGKKEFRTRVETNMTSAGQTIERPVEQGFEGVLQGEINKNVHGLRKMHEDWQNAKIPNVPKALQITVELGAEGGKPKLLKLDLHNPSLSSRIKDDLTKKIKTWKFESLFDGKDDPKKWPIKLTGKISWQK
jgi:hypothetical protein